MNTNTTVPDLRTAASDALATIDGTPHGGNYALLRERMEVVRAALAQPAASGAQPDERAAFEGWAIRAGFAFRDEKHGIYSPAGGLAHAWEAWQARAALTQPPTVTTESQEPRLRAMAANYAGGHCWDQLDTEACIQAADEIRALRAELERERMCHAACGVVAMANTRESAAKARDMRPEYWSASVQDVARAVDREMTHREALQAITPAAQDVLAERARQVSAEGWTPEHDDEHSRGEMAAAAACYCVGDADPRADVPTLWPWAPEWWKPGTERRMLVKAGALILAELERLDRAAASAVGQTANAA
jgi:hypothetical protein